MCITVTGSAVVGAAVVHKQPKHAESEAVLFVIDKQLEASGVRLVLSEDELDLSSAVLLLIPAHG